MVINKYAKKILIARECDRADARVKGGNIKDKEKKKRERGCGEIFCPRRRRANEDKGEENVIIAW